MSCQLIQRGVNGKLLKLIVNMYEKAKCRVKWKEEVSNEIDSQFGVLQGGMTSPKLFTEFLFDLKTYLDEGAGINLDDSVLNYMLYADDLVLCSETREGLQKLLNGLFDFCRDWHLILNLAKTNVLIHGDKKHARFTFNGDEVSVATEYKYLGTVFSTNCRDPLKKTKEHLVIQKKRGIIGAHASLLS